MPRVTPTSEVPRLSCSLRETAQSLNIGLTTLNRAISHGMVPITKNGRAVSVPMAVVQRIAREGLGPIPPGYCRQTTGKLPPRLKKKPPRA